MAVALWITTHFLFQRQRYDLIVGIRSLFPQHEITYHIIVPEKLIKVIYTACGHEL